MKATKQLTIKNITRLNNTCYGNPRYLIEAVDEKNNTIYGKTASNAQIGYIISNQLIEKTFKISLHETVTGSIIFDKLEK